MQGGSMRSHGGTLYRSWVARGCTMIVTLTLGACDGERPTDPSVGGAVLGKATTEVTVTSTEPSSSARNVTLDVRVLGSGFDQSAQATFLLDGVPDPRVRTNSTRYVKANEVVANLTIGADATPDLYSVQVALSSGRKGIGTEKFLVSSIVQLSAPAGASLARAVNASGTMVGTRAGGCGNLPVVWTSPATITDLPLPNGECSADPSQVNDAGQVLGTAHGGTGAVLWTAGAGGGWSVQVLGVAPDGVIPEAAALNDAGLVVGAAILPNDQSQIRPYSWTAADGWHPMLLLEASKQCVPSATNDSGQIVGDCFDASGQGVPVIWPSASSVPLRLPLPGAATGNAADVNGAGTIAGTVRFGSGHTLERYAARWVGSPGSYSVELIGGLLGPQGQGNATGINESGQIVGRSDISGGV